MKGKSNKSELFATIIYRIIAWRGRNGKAMPEPFSNQIRSKFDHHLIPRSFYLPIERNAKIHLVDQLPPIGTFLIEKIIRNICCEIRWNSTWKSENDVEKDQFDRVH